MSATTTAERIGDKAIDTVIVTGMHRSGTTFVAELLGAADGAELLRVEPFNVDWGLRSAAVWYPIIDAAGQPEDPAVKGAVADLSRITRGLPVRWKSHPTSFTSQVRVQARLARRNAQVARARALRRPMVLKDPFLSLSLPFAAAHTDRPIVVTSRHPVAWVQSLRRMDWHPGVLVTDLVQRPALRPVLDELGVPECDWLAEPMLEAASWAWAILAAGMQRDIDALSSDRVVRLPLESMKDNPLAVATDLMARVGLGTSAQWEARVAALTSGPEAPADSRELHVLQRDTRSSVDAWRTRVPVDEQRAIWQIVEPAADGLYAL